MLGNILNFFLPSADFLHNQLFQMIFFRNAILLSSSLDPDEAGHSVGPDLGLYCLHHTTTASKRVKPPASTVADVF